MIDNVSDRCSLFGKMFDATPQIAGHGWEKSLREVDHSQHGSFQTETITVLKVYYPLQENEGVNSLS